MGSKAPGGAASRSVRPFTISASMSSTTSPTENSRPNSAAVATTVKLTRTLCFIALPVRLAVLPAHPDLGVDLRPDLAAVHGEVLLPAHDGRVGRPVAARDVDGD